MADVPLQVVVAKFATDSAAAEALRSLTLARNEGIFRLKFAAIVWRDAKARIRYRDLHDRLGGLVDRGIPTIRLQELGETLLPGTSMLVVVIEHRWVQQIGATLKRAGADLVFTSLREEFEQRWPAGKAVTYAAYVNDQPVPLDQERTAAAPDGDLMVSDRGVLVQDRVLTRAGIVDREIVIDEHGVHSSDKPVALPQPRGSAVAAFAALDEEARRRIATVENDPERRYKLRVHFYNTYGRGQRTAGFGNSELNFMRWEINRGVLRAPDDPERPGSAWWRAVNGHFCYRAELGVLAAEAGLDPHTLPPAVRSWVEYIRRPSPAGWYRAHNSSIVEGYILYEDLARTESPYEQFFMNKVLYRVTYAASMVTGRSFGPLGPLMSHPALPAVEILVSIPHFYPQNYPVTFVDKMHILHTGSSLWGRMTRILDEWFILPRLPALYQWAAQWLEMPELARYAAGRKPIYPYHAR